MVILFSASLGIAILGGVATSYVLHTTCLSEKARKLKVEILIVLQLVGYLTAAFLLTKM